MKKLLLIPTLFCALFFVACDPSLKGTGDVITVTRDIDGFHAIDISTCGQVEMLVDSVFSLEVSCEESILPYLDTYVENGVLVIEFDRNVWNVDGLHIRVSAPSWDGIKLSGSANINVPDEIFGDDLSLKLSGSGLINIAKADFIDTRATISGSGAIFLHGQGDDLHATVTGSGNINAREFPVKTATAAITGSGNIRLNVSETLDATISGSGNIEYEGNPQVTRHVSGSGNIRKL